MAEATHLLAAAIVAGFHPEASPAVTRSAVVTQAQATLHTHTQVAPLFQDRVRVHFRDLAPRHSVVPALREMGLHEMAFGAASALGPTGEGTAPDTAAAAMVAMGTAFIPGDPPMILTGGGILIRLTIRSSKIRLA